MFDMPGMPRSSQNLPVRRESSTLAEVLRPVQAGGPWDSVLPPWWPRRRDERADWWDYACGCARRLRTGQPLPTIEVFGPVLEPGEHALLSADIGYSRRYGSDAQYEAAPLVLLGKPATMVGALAIRGMINRRRKKTAEAQAAVGWREHETASVIVTTLRLICTLSYGQVSIWHDTVAAIYPDLQQSELTLGFEDSYPPIRLSGPPAPALSLWSARFVLGPDRWHKDPRLAALG